MLSGTADVDGLRVPSGVELVLPRPAEPQTLATWLGGLVEGTMLIQIWKAVGTRPRMQGTELCSRARYVQSGRVAGFITFMFWCPYSVDSLSVNGRWAIHVVKLTKKESWDRMTVN